MVYLIGSNQVEYLSVFCLWSVIGLFREAIYLLIAKMSLAVCFRISLFWKLHSKSWAVPKACQYIIP